MNSESKKFEILFHDLRYHYTEVLDYNRLIESSKNLKEAFSIPEELSLKWFNVSHWELYHTDIDSTLCRIFSAIDPTDVVVIWLTGYHMPLNNFIVSKLNEFSKPIPNPVLYCSGALGPWFTEPNNTHFTICKLRYYEFESHLFSLRNNSCVRSNLASISNSTTKPNKFMFMGTKDYPNRKYLLSNIITNNLHTEGLVSYKQHMSAELTLAAYSADEIEEINKVANLADLFLPLPHLDDSMEYAEMPRKFLLDSYVNVVTDTYFDCSLGTTFLSEKVFNAIANWQLFIIMAPAYTLRYLKSCGYKTFSPYIDESYDNVENNYQRILAVTKSTIDFLKKPIEEIKDIYEQCLPIIEHNKQVLSSCTVPIELQTAITQAIQQKTV